MEAVIKSAVVERQRVYQDAKSIEQNINKFLQRDTFIKEIIIEADLRVRYGGCLIETPTGNINARIESQFELID